MAHISVCKNVIAANNKRKWVEPQPAIRVSKTKSGKVTDRAFTIGIPDKDGNIVARIITTKDGTPVIKCGAKVGIVTEYPIIVID
jgi:hypothetical protein